MTPIPIEYENLHLLNAPFFDEYKQCFAKSLDTGWFILGNQVKSFEEEFAAYCGINHCAGVASGLDALILALKVFNFPTGSEVIVPSNTYIASILAIYHSGLVPVLAEPDIHTYNIDPAKIEECITLKTKAILVVHLYGKACNMEAILTIADRYDLKVVEDCAQSHGAMFKGKKTGTFGDFGAFSFYPTKNLGALGDGGALTGNNSSLMAMVRALRNYGSTEKYINEYIGINSRLDEIQAGFLSIKLKKLDLINHHKRKLAALYQEHLKDDYIKPVVHSDYFDVYHIYAIRHPRRQEIREYLSKNGVITEIHYPVPPHHQKALKDHLKGHFPISEEIHRTTLSLPVSFCHTESQIERVIELLNAF
ncbi:DegT/DnrJ/EryC1/StrS family aminotransferase (plasmid) [Pedobacter sp. BS3]|uniref:DegT/DnrJ/EryC1/StrS family aminotransferase n=1 Tax=Pedobacter sp. BS3 TaxID=2567937 RepID=UPI0011EC642E|nr:DegT/DnrJ/EryC1/StrS family aminotransferase [Pedobacter sp. BS3]TZF85916.1 DegT/DnrJ/EryC1/StrS family aminotransferase [Pedobacter sp. BS3]